MNKTINIIIVLLIVLTMCLVTFSVTYAWFIAKQSTNNVSGATSGKLEIIYDKGQDVTGTLKPSLSKENGLEATVKIRQSETSVNGLGTITLNVVNIDPELAVNGLKWELYKDSSSLPISTGTFNAVTSNSQIDLIKDSPLTTVDTKFTLYIWLNGSEVNNSVMNKSFSAYISATARSKSANLE